MDLERQRGNAAIHNGKKREVRHGPTRNGIMLIADVQSYKSVLNISRPNHKFNAVANQLKANVKIIDVREVSIAILRISDALSLQRCD